MVKIGPRRSPRTPAASSIGDFAPDALNALPVRIGDQPVVVVFNPGGLLVLGADVPGGQADALEYALEANGGKLLAMPPTFAAHPAPGWKADLNGQELAIRFPSGEDFYRGTLIAEKKWTTSVHTAGTVVIAALTGPIRNPSEIAPALGAGRAWHVRVPITIDPAP